MKYKNIITLTLATLIISSASITLYYKMKPSPHLSLTCNSSLTYHADTFMVSSDISLTFYSNEKGVLFISGEIFNQENKLEINKRINFNYHHIDKNDYSRFQIISATFMERCRRGGQLLKVVRSSRQRNKQYYHELSAVDRGQKISDFGSFGTGNFGF